MPTGYEVELNRNLGRIADALDTLARMRVDETVALPALTDAEQIAEANAAANRLARWEAGRPSRRLDDDQLAATRREHAAFARRRVRVSRPSGSTSTTTSPCPLVRALGQACEGASPAPAERPAA